MCSFASKCHDKYCVHRTKHELDKNCRPIVCDTTGEYVECIPLEKDAIKIWRYEDAPQTYKDYRNVETGNEDFLVWIPQAFIGNIPKILDLPKGYKYDSYTMGVKGMLLVRSLAPEALDW